MSVVIADDVEQMRDLLTRIFERDSRFEVVGAASDGEEAVALVEKLKPDVILLDLMMPNKSGLQASREIRELSPSTRIVILSGVTSDTAIHALPADGVLEKGTPSVEIVALVARLTSNEPT